MKLQGSIVSKGICIGILGFILGFFVCTKFNKNYDNLNYLNFKSQQDSLNLVVDSLRKRGEKIITKIDYRLDTIEKVNIKYEKDINVMLHQPTDSQCQFFSKYVLSQESRFLNSNNSKAINDK